MQILMCMLLCKHACTHAFMPIHAWRYGAYTWCVQQNKITKPCVYNLNWYDKLMRFMNAS